ncbi:MAG: ABC transporter permease [Candidatus Eisenbacteria bacterium]|uniref:ABC transporter permease n=1 Tax=Eiseniibacteriota bacterium TaxID=2212470 RepID=A0A956NAS9_UNCEI|nr:ABC transporter permease [Candidatus Eisenbacteria bacterium]MCB9465463.1 ABC transporter permease [Candidatus Eisenbacteria bacterium]
MRRAPSARGLLGQNLVPLLFAALCIAGIVAARDAIALEILAGDIVTRLGRNLFLVLSLIVPVVAGMGLNFGIVIGAMCGQVGLILVENAGWSGLGALGAAMLFSIPLSLVFGGLTGRLLNRAKGKEMITGMILAFFANGVYQMIFLLLTGPVIPLHNQKILLDDGIGLANTIDLAGTAGKLDHLLRISFLGGRIQFPLATFLLIALLCLGLRWYLRTRSGQQLRTVGQDMHVAEISGIGVDRVRMRAILISTVLGGIGQILWLTSTGMGTMNTYSSHEQVGPYAIAAILVGGATVTHATIWHAILGTLLFHTLFVVAPLAGQAVFGAVQIGEYFREFVAYAVIGVTLALHAWKSRRG